MTQHNHSPGINSVNEDMRSLLRSVDRQVRRGVFDVSVKPDNSNFDRSSRTQTIEQAKKEDSIPNPNSSLGGIKVPKKRPDLPKQTRSQVLKRTNIKKTFTAIHPNKHHRPLRQFIYIGAVLVFVLTCTGLVFLIYSKSGKTQYPVQKKSVNSEKILILENSFY